MRIVRKAPKVWVGEISYCITVRASMAILKSSKLESLKRQTPGMGALQDLWVMIFA